MGCRPRRGLKWLFVFRFLVLTGWAAKRGAVTGCALITLNIDLNPSVPETVKESV
jgi:hypothetical protein